MAQLDLILVQKLVLSILLGFLIGIERERKKAEEQDLSFGGIRTFPLIALLGSVTAAFSVTMGNNYFVLAAFLVLSGLVIVSDIYYSFIHNHAGITSEMSALLTFLIGVSVIHFSPLLSITSTILLALILSLKQQLHRFSDKIQDVEFYAGLKFLIITFIVLPFLPNSPIDPWMLFNPYKIWLYAVIISAISFGGYIAVKIIGPKYGIHSTGFIGGIVSSTSVCSIFAKRAKENKKLLFEYGNGALLSYVSSIIKVAFVIGLLNQILFWKMLPALLALIITGLIAWFISMKKHNGKKNVASDINLPNPFTIRFGIQFALILTVVLTMSELAQKYFGDVGIYIVSFLSGLAKIDAITVSMANLAGGSVQYEVAARAIMLGAFFSGAAKCGYSFAFGGKDYGRAISPYLLVTGLAGLLVSFL